MEELDSISLYVWNPPEAAVTIHISLEQEGGGEWLSIASRGRLIVTWNRRGCRTLEVSRAFEPCRDANVNVIYPHMAVTTLRRALNASHTELVSLHFASPAPGPRKAVFERARRILISSL